MLQSAYGIHHLHHLKPKGITHRDIKLSNILVSGSQECPVIMIADFGEAKFIDRIKDRSLSVHSVRGTFPYMAPELFRLSVDKKAPSYNKSVNVYSLGVSSLAVLDAQEGSVVVAVTGKLSTRMHCQLVLIAHRPIIQLCSGITLVRVLNGELYA